MGVPGISAQGPHTFVAPPPAWTPSRGAPDQAPKEAAPAAPPQYGPAPGETKQTIHETLSDVSGVRLRVDADTHRIIAEIVDENDKVVRQIPPEEALRIATMTRQLLGLLFDQQA